MNQLERLWWMTWWLAKGHRPYSRRRVMTQADETRKLLERVTRQTVEQLRRREIMKAFTPSLFLTTTFMKKARVPVTMSITLPPRS